MRLCPIIKTKLEIGNLMILYLYITNMSQCTPPVNAQKYEKKFEFNWNDDAQSILYMPMHSFNLP